MTLTLSHTPAAHFNNFTRSYSGQSYKHLEFKRAGDLNSAPGQRKNMLGRFLKKLDHPDANVEELEDCEIDESYVQVERILDEKIDQVRESREKYTVCFVERENGIEC